MNRARKIFQIIFIIIITISLIAISIFTLSEKKYSWNELVEEADCILTVSREIIKCETRNGYYAMCAYRGEEPYKKDGKTYTEVYIACQCGNIFGEKITIVCDNNYLSDKEAFYTLFLKCIDKEKGLYTPVNGNTGIIQWETGYYSSKITPRPLDHKLNSKEFTLNLEKYIYNDWEYFCKQNTLNT